MISFVSDYYIHSNNYFEEEEKNSSLIFMFIIAFNNLLRYPFEFCKNEIWTNSQQCSHIQLCLRVCGRCFSSCSKSLQIKQSKGILLDKVKDPFNIKKKYHFITSDSQPTEVNCTIKSNTYKLKSQQMFIVLNSNLCFKDILLNVLTAPNSCSKVLENLFAWEYFTSGGCLEDYLGKQEPTTVFHYNVM